MEIVMKQYQRKPFIVEAVRIDRTNFQDISKKFDGVITWRDGIVEAQGSPIGPEAKVDPTSQYIWLETHNPTNERQSRAHLGDWVLVTNQGIKIYHNRSFIAQFEVVEEPASAPNMLKTESQVHAEIAEEEKIEKDETPDNKQRLGVGETNFGDYKPVPENVQSPAMTQAVETIEADGGTVEEATPEGIADAVHNGELAISAEEHNEEAMAESDKLEQMDQGTFDEKDGIGDGTSWVERELRLPTEEAGEYPSEEPTMIDEIHGRTEFTTSEIDLSKEPEFDQGEPPSHLDEVSEPEDFQDINAGEEPQ